ncbi:hypothetical protein ACJMK2_018346 [Sinanodonta woodiana]|uniref:E3 ubiquitin-protein ligase APD1-4 middle domain-containing protein n=1 Tax=Sinanodonta woodiana TaxID=1069815 RepID=A0ABD3UD60_SINWO
MMHDGEFLPSDSDGCTGNSSFHGLQDSERNCICDESNRCHLISIFFKKIMCLRKLKRRTRVAIIWVWLTTIFLPMALIFRFGMYADQSVTASSQDMRTVDGISTEFCEKVTIKSSNIIDAYLFPNYPDISPRLLSSNMKKNASVGVNKYEYWGFYIIKGSTVKVSSCISRYTALISYMDFYVIKGKDKLKEWESDGSCITCYTYYTNIYKKCAFFESNDLLLNISETDEYYFAFSNQVKSILTLQVNFKFNRAVYNITYAINQCIRTTSCTFNLESRSSMVAAFYVEGIDQSDITVTYSCEARLLLYISAFFLIPTVFGICASLTVICCCRNKLRTNPSSQQHRIWYTSHFLNSVDQTNEIYTDLPPSYDDVICGRV